MRSINTTGGLTTGQGMSKSQRALWILSMPDWSEVNNAMHDVTDRDVIFVGLAQRRRRKSSKRFLWIRLYLLPFLRSETSLLKKRV